jgi:hypothetical protein
VISEWNRAYTAPVSAYIKGSLGLSVRMDSWLFELAVLSFCLFIFVYGYRKDKTPFWNHLHLSPVRSAGGEVLHATVLSTDILFYILHEDEHLMFQLTDDTLYVDNQRLALFKL